MCWCVRGVSWLQLILKWFVCIGVSCAKLETVTYDSVVIYASITRIHGAFLFEIRLPLHNELLHVNSQWSLFCAHVIYKSIFNKWIYQTPLQLNNHTRPDTREWQWQGLQGSGFYWCMHIEKTYVSHLNGKKTYGLCSESYVESLLWWLRS